MMPDKIVHAVTPVVVIVCTTVLACLHVIDSSTAVALIAGAGGYGAIAVAKA